MAPRWGVVSPCAALSSDLTNNAPAVDGRVGFAVTGPWDSFPLAREAALRRAEDTVAPSLQSEVGAL